MRSIRVDLRVLSTLAECFKEKGDNLRHERILAIRQCYDNYTEAQMEYLINHYQEELLKDDLGPELNENLKEVTVK